MKIYRAKACEGCGKSGVPLNINYREDALGDPQKSFECNDCLALSNEEFERKANDTSEKEI
jgi:hypothetical protein